MSDETSDAATTPGAEAAKVKAGAEREEKKAATQAGLAEAREAAATKKNQRRSVILKRRKNARRLAGVPNGPTITGDVADALEARGYPVEDFYE